MFGLLQAVTSPATRGLVQEVGEQAGKVAMRGGVEHGISTRQWMAMSPGKRMFKGSGTGLKFAYKGAGPIILGMAAFQGGMAARGHKASTFMTSLVAQAPGAIIGGALGALVGFPSLGAIAGGMVLDPIFTPLIGKPLQSFTEIARRNSRMEMGGGFQDSQQALTMRQVASQEMSHSVLNARHYLGKEGAFMHQ